MTAIRDWLDANGNQLECEFYAGLYYTSFSAALASAYTGQAWLAAGLGGVAYAAEWTAKQAGCFYNEPEGPKDTPTGAFKRDEDCWETVEPGDLYIYVGTGSVGADATGWRNLGEATRIWSIQQAEDGDIDGKRETVWKYQTTPEAEITEFLGAAPIGQPYAQLRNAGCADEPPEYEYPDPIGPGTEVDTEDGCKWSVTPIDAYVDDQGVWHTYYEVTPDKPECGDPFGYWSDGAGGGDAVNPGPPVEPDPDNPNPPTPPSPPPPGANQPCPDVSIPDLPAALYSLQGVCETVGEGQDQPVFTYSVDTANAFANLAGRIDALALMLQKHLELRTPVCNESNRPKLEGNWVTAQWQSEVESANSRFRLRKLTRWRSKSGRTDPELAEFFRDFSWTAGSVCVGHKDAWWGTPQVWAASVAEGRRVLREIAREAGIDPDLEGQWWDSVSRNPRFGQEGKMTLRNCAGYPWVHSREGSDLLPYG